MTYKRNLRTNYKTNPLSNLEALELMRDPSFTSAHGISRDPRFPGMEYDSFKIRYNSTTGEIMFPSWNGLSDDGYSMLEVEIREGKIVPTNGGIVSKSLKKTIESFNSNQN